MSYLMKLIAIGANLPSRYGTPQEACQAALALLEATGTIQVTACSGWWETAPVPASDQPWYVNGVAVVETALSASDLLHQLHIVETEMGRVRTVANAARVIDLDLIAYDHVLSDDSDLQLPHPRMHLRTFVLAPLCDIAPGWIHPVLLKDARSLLNALPAGEKGPQALRRAAQPE